MCVGLCDEGQVGPGAGVIWTLNSLDTCSACNIYCKNIRGTKSGHSYFTALPGASCFLLAFHLMDHDLAKRKKKKKVTPKEEEKVDSLQLKINLKKKQSQAVMWLLLMQHLKSKFCRNFWHDNFTTRCHVLQAGPLGKTSGPPCQEPSGLRAMVLFPI